MQYGPHRTVLTPSIRHWVLLFAGFLTVLFTVALVLPTNAIRVWYWVRVVGPVQESQFGFKAELSHAGNRLTIVSIVSGGAFDRAGVKPGWVSAQPTCFACSQAQLVFEALRDTHASGYPARLRFYEGDPARQGNLRWVLVRPARRASQPAA